MPAEILPVQADQAAHSSAPRRTSGALALIGAAVILLLSLGAFVVGASVHGSAADGSIGSPASDFSLRDSTDRRVTLAELTDGRPVLLVFSQSDGFDLPIDAAARALLRSPATRLVCVQKNARNDATASQLADRIQSPVVVLADPDRAVADAYGVDVLPSQPYAVLVSADGQIKDRGPVDQCLARLGNSGEIEAN